MTAPYLQKLREQREHRRLRVAQLLRDNPSLTNQELVKALGPNPLTITDSCPEGKSYNRETIAEDRKFLMEQITQQTVLTVEEYRQQQLDRCRDDREELEDLRARLVDHLIPPIEAIDLALKIIDRRDKVDEREMKLTGTAAPSRSETLNLNANAEDMDEYRLMVKACAGLDQEQRTDVRRYARSLPRKSAPMAQPPKTSPLWESKQLEAGDETA
jgi:hypothetical protein